MPYRLFIAGIKFFKWIARDKTPLAISIDVVITGGENNSVRSINIPL